MLTEKPKAIIITVRDRKSNKSKSITLYETSLEEIFKKIEAALSSK